MLISPSHYVKAISRDSFSPQREMSSHFNVTPICLFVYTPICIFILNAGENDFTVTCYLKIGNNE